MAGQAVTIPQGTETAVTTVLIESGSGSLSISAADLLRPIWGEEQAYERTNGAAPTIGSTAPVVRAPISVESAFELVAMKYDSLMRRLVD
jgi:hypothetical protein